MLVKVHSRVFTAKCSEPQADASNGRAIIKKPNIYIFDDSFSALDFKTDAKLRAALKQEVDNSAVIIVARRISTILDADMILVMKDGTIAEQGNHQQLLEKNGFYAELYNSQFAVNIA